MTRTGGTMLTTKEKLSITRRRDAVRKELKRLLDEDQAADRAWVRGEPPPCLPRGTDDRGAGGGRAHLPLDAGPRRYGLLLRPGREVDDHAAGPGERRLRPPGPAAQNRRAL